MNNDLAATVSDPLPIAWAFRFDRNGVGTAATDISAADLAMAREGFVWVHVNLADARGRALVRALPMLDEDMKALLLGEDEHIRLSGGGTAVWGIVSDFGREPDGIAETLCQMRFHCAERLLVTARRHPVQSAQAARQAILAGRLHASPLALLEEIVVNIVAAIEDETEKLIAAMNAIEDRVLNDQVHDDRQRLGPLRRRAVTLHRCSSGLLRLLARFSEPSGLHESVQTCLRRLAQRLENIHHDVHSTLDRARLLQDEVAAKLASETNRQLYVLTILSTLMLPPTLVTGIFGMNTKGALFTDNDNAFVYALVICVASALAAYAIVLILGRRRPG